MSTTVIDVQNLVKTYTTYKRGSTFAESVKSLFVRKPMYIDAVSDISFSIEKGEICGFLGPNGAGKSTSLKILTGILFPTYGNVNILGYCPWKQRKQYVAHIGAVFGQKSQLLWDIPPADAFELNRAIYNVPKKTFQYNLERMVEMLDVADVICKPTRVLSLGERMKCEFIIAMLHDPEIVFLDEPTIGLDVIAKETIRNFIREMNRTGVTFILTTHDLDDIECLARHIIVINHGQIIFDDSIEKLKRYFGTKKKIRLLSEKDPDGFSMPGLQKVELHIGNEIVFELDLEKTSLKKFINAADRKLVIRDLSVEEIPIESVIASLYR